MNCTPRRPAGLEALQERAPMDFGFAEGHGDTQDLAFAIRADAQGNEHGAVQQLAALADFFVAGVDDQIRKRSQRPLAPILQMSIQLGRALADLGGADGDPAERFDNGGNFACRDALHIHFGQSQLESLFAARALLQGAGIKLRVAAHLGNLKSDGSQRAGHRLGLVAIGLAQTGGGAFVRLGLQRARALLAHGLVDQEADAFGETAGALLGEELQNGVQEFRFGWAGRLILHV
jgi:hypothetical protein